MTRSYVGAYWGAREESAEQCAARLAQLLPALADIDPLLSGWRDKGKSKKQALASPLVTTDQADLVPRLLAGRNRRDDNGEVIEELGYSVGWWNGSDNNRTAVDLSVACAATSPYVSNSVVINLPDSKAAPSLYTTASARRLLETLIGTFVADSAVWTNNGLVNQQTEPDRPLEGGGYALGQLVGHPAGWATYLADSDSVTFDHAPLPPSARTERVGAGTLVIVGDDPADPPLTEVLAVRAAMGYEVRVPDLKPSTPVSAPAQGTGTDAIPPLETGATPPAKPGERAGKADGESEQPRSRPGEGAF